MFRNSADSIHAVRGAQAYRGSAYRGSLAVYQVDGRAYAAIQVRGKYVRFAQRLCAGFKFKWIRILFRCWKERKPYDEVIYLRAQCPLPETQLAAPAV
jgi:hypothetical protein